MSSEVPAACTRPYCLPPTRQTRFTWSQMFASPSACTTSSSGSSSPFDCSAAQVIGWPCESSGGVPAASEAMILPSRSPQASASTSTFTPGCFASKRLAMFLAASWELGCVSVCHTRMTFCAWALESTAASSNAATLRVVFIFPPPRNEEILNQIARPAADRERLAGDVLAGIAGEEQRHVRDVLRGNGRMHAHALQQPPAHFFLVYAEAFCLRLDHALDALALDHAGLDAVDAHLFGTGFGGQALREADHRPFCRRIRGAHREGKAPGGRRQVDDAAAARRLDHRHRLARAVEHAVQVHRDAAVPVLGADVLDPGGRSRYAGVVHQHVEAAELALDVAEQPLDIGQLRHVGDGTREVALLESFFIHITDMDAGALVGKGAGNDPADAGAARRDQHAQPVGGCFHGDG